MARYIDLILRLGVAFTFLYPPLNALVDPYSWMGYLPTFMRGIVPDMVLLHAFGLLEVAIAVWLIIGKRIFIPSALAFAILVAIVVLDMTEFQVVFRDVSIAATALALALTHMPGRTTEAAV